MKLTITEDVITTATKSAINVINNTADVTHRNINTDHLKKLMDFPNKEISRKWGSISAVDGVVTVDINDECVTDIIIACRSVCTKIIPTMMMVYGILHMFKNHIKDMKNIFSDIRKKYTEEYEYTAMSIVFPGVETGYIIFYRVKGDTKWIAHTTDISLNDEFLTMGHEVHRAMVNRINNVATNDINSDGQSESTPVFDSIGDAEAYIKNKLQDQDIDKIEEILMKDVTPWNVPLDDQPAITPDVDGGSESDYDYVDDDTDATDPHDENHTANIDPDSFTTT